MDAMHVSHVSHKHNGPWHLVDATSNIQSSMRELREKLVKHSKLLALDMEWRPDRSKDSNNKVALIQMAIGDAVWLFRTCEIGLPDELRKILQDRAVTKLVVSFDSADRKKLQHSFGLQNCEGLLDIHDVAKRLRIEGCGLKKLTARYGLRIEKDKEISISKWDAATLSKRQLQYARDDAFFTLWVSCALLREASACAGAAALAPSAAKALEALEGSWADIDGAMAVEDTTARDLAVSRFVAEVHAALRAQHGSNEVKLSKVPGLPSRGEPGLQKQAQTLQIRFSKDFFNQHKGRFQILGDQVRARSAFEMAPLETNELEMDWTEADALQRWREGGAGGVCWAEQKGRLGLLGAELRRLGRKKEANAVDRCMATGGESGHLPAGNRTTGTVAWKLPEGQLSEQQRYDATRTVFAHELPRSLHIKELTEKLRSQLAELPLEKIALFRPKNGDQNRGFGFLVFGSADGAQIALKKQVYIDDHLARMQPYAPPTRVKREVLVG